MRLKALIMLVAFIVIVIAPVHINVYQYPDNKTASLLTLDVCNASGSGLSVQADTPWMLDGLFSLFLSEGIYFHEILQPAFHAFLISFQQERPPRS